MKIASASNDPDAAQHAPTDTVAIMLGTFDGGRFLEKQLRTLAEQSHRSIDLWVSDDGSTDGSIEILSRFEKHWDRGVFHLLNGPALGFAENYRFLITNPDIDATYYAFCDQDDIWDPDKLEVAVAWLSSQDPAVPALYCSRTRTIDEEDHDIGYSSLFENNPNFRNAIVQSIAGGNTMVMNRAARDIVAEASRRTSFVSHDWWSYMIVSGVGGTVHYSATPHIGYRQHQDNIAGANTSLSARLQRYSFLIQGGFSQWTETNLAGLNLCRDLLTPDARDVLREVELARSRSILTRLTHLRRSGAYRQSAGGHLGLYLACLLGKL
ncbi:glycosyltransferase family 2 protein [Oryzicola mucosus]|uniref:Glycosyltransferase family 2 protein n=1 Tax=Oryzicola mucosus TaxID=2767425 RepID=A0A8J6PQ98_9HYPH|nr:glycosyltransferase family 2 protein [Oryzicola mucosus]MBD0415980.1 glycosyltransferase family 2 protein [Oryzicola mucosus]